MDAVQAVYEKQRLVFSSIKPVFDIQAHVFVLPHLAASSTLALLQLPRHSLETPSSLVVSRRTAFGCADISFWPGGVSHKASPSVPFAGRNETYDALPAVGHGPLVSQSARLRETIRQSPQQSLRGGTHPRVRLSWLFLLRNCSRESALLRLVEKAVAATVVGVGWVLFYRQLANRERRGARKYAAAHALVSRLAFGADSRPAL